MSQHSNRLHVVPMTLAAARGYRLCITYTLLTEPGTSLVAAGWRPVAVTRGGTWSRAGRERDDKHPMSKKIRWECQHGISPSIKLGEIRGEA